jgi:hypothetical protein
LIVMFRCLLVDVIASCTRRRFRDRGQRAATVLEPRLTVMAELA